MILPFLPRLIFLLSASFFAAYVTSALLASLVARRALRWTENLRPRQAALLLLTIRLLPAAFAIAIPLFLCLPSYLWLEPRSVDEPVSLVFVLAACLGGILVTISGARALRAFFGQHQIAGRDTSFGPEFPAARITPGSAPYLALTGIVQPRIVISERVMATLSSQELDVVLRHERSHREAADNFKRLCISLFPLPLRCFQDLEQAWTRATEFAADDDAVSGDPHRSLTLASALVTVARCGITPPSKFATSLVGDSSDLTARVERLIATPPVPRRSIPSRTYTFVAFAMLALLLNPITLQLVQTLLERAIR